jgi:hypothetical protein
MMDGIAAQSWRRGMSSLALHLNVHLQPAAVPHAHLQITGLAQHHKVRANALFLHQRPYSQSLAWLFLDNADDVQVTGQLDPRIQ